MNSRKREYVKYKKFKKSNCEICFIHKDIMQEIKPGMYMDGMDLHHKYMLSKGGSFSENGMVTLCRKCHNRVHKKLKDILARGAT